MIMGEYVDIADFRDGTLRGYVATPANGSGPGVVLLHEIFGVTRFMREQADLLAEEGYVVVVPELFWRVEPGIELDDSEDDRPRAFELYQSFDFDRSVADIARVVQFIRSRPEHAGKVGVVGYCMGGLLAVLTAARTRVDCGVGYYPTQLEDHLPELKGISVPFALQIAGADQYSSEEVQQAVATAVADHPDVTIDVYPGASHPFANPYREGYDRGVAALAYTRMIEVLRSTMGPHYDLSALWDEHLRLEFAAKDAGATMATMVSEPYVNHVPTLTGGTGYDLLARFYQYHFIHHNPEQRIIPISRTIGVNRVVDEFVACLNHDREIPWLLPGVKPTGKYVEIPVVSIVGFRGGKLHHEHIYWDQASLLVQIGLLEPGGLPVAGLEVARKAVDETLPSNELMPDWQSSEGRPIPPRSQP